MDTVNRPIELFDLWQRFRLLIPAILQLTSRNTKSIAFL